LKNLWSTACGYEFNLTINSDYNFRVTADKIDMERITGSWRMLFIYEEVVVFELWSEIEPSKMIDEIKTHEIKAQNDYD